jgi:hypothetical protein
VTIGYLAFRASSKSPPSAAEATYLTLFATITNLLAVGAWARVGRADPAHARSAVRRLFSIGQALTRTSQALERAIASGTPARVNQQAQVTLEEVSMAIFLVSDSIADWNEVHSEALREVLRDREGFGA